MGRATEKMLSFARAIADELDLDLPTKHDANGHEVPDESFDAISDFIDQNKEDFYEWSRA